MLQRPPEQEFLVSVRTMSSTQNKYKIQSLSLKTLRSYISPYSYFDNDDSGLFWVEKISQLFQKPPKQIKTQTQSLKTLSSQISPYSSFDDVASLVGRNLFRLLRRPPKRGFWPCSRRPRSRSHHPLLSTVSLSRETGHSLSRSTTLRQP